MKDKNLVMFIAGVVLCIVGGCPGFIVGLILICFSIEGENNG